MFLGQVEDLERGMKIREVERCHFSGGEEKAVILHHLVLIKIGYLTITKIEGGLKGQRCQENEGWKSCFAKIKEKTADLRNKQVKKNFWKHGKVTH